MATLALALATLAAIGALIAFRRRERAWAARVAKLQHLLYEAALRESELNIAIAEEREQLEFWREGARFAQIQDTKTRVIPR